MNNLDSSQGKGYKIENVKGHVTITPITGNHNITTFSVGENIKTDNETISKLDPEFSKSITEFRDLLKEKLNDKKATEEQIKKINENIDNLAGELEGVKADQTVEDEGKKDDINSKLINLADAIVDVAPDIAEYIVSVTPLAPVGKAIGRGIEYVSGLIKRKIKK